MKNKLLSSLPISIGSGSGSFYGARVRMGLLLVLLMVVVMVVTMVFLTPAADRAIGKVERARQLAGDDPQQFLVVVAFCAVGPHARLVKVDLELVGGRS